MSECTHDCSTCGESCGERKEANVFEKSPSTRAAGWARSTALCPARAA